MTEWLKRMFCRGRERQKRETGSGRKRRQTEVMGVGVVEVKERGENIDIVICLEGNITYVCIYFNR